MTAQTDQAKTPLIVPFVNAHTWNVAAQFAVQWRWDDKDIKELGSALTRRIEAAADTLPLEAEVTLLTIRFDGSIEPRQPQRICDVKGKLFRVHPGDVVFSKIDVRNGAIGVAPDTIPNMCVTSEFPVYTVQDSYAASDYVKLLFRTRAFMRLLNSMISGASGRKRIQPSQLEQAKVPLPDLRVQRAIAQEWSRAERVVSKHVDDFEGLTLEVDGLMRSKTSNFDDTCKSKFFVSSYDLTRQWDMKAGRAAHFIGSNPAFVRLGEYTEECSETVRPWDDPDKEWPIYGVNNKDGVFLNSHQKGKDFNAPYKRIKKDWFFHNPTRANVGSLGKVPTVPEDAITSPEYQVWRLTGGFLPEFMALLIRTDYFLSLVDFNRVGGVKQRMYYSNLAEIRLPMIPMQEQQAIADRYAALLEDIENARAELVNKKQDIEQMILGTMKIKGN